VPICIAEARQVALSAKQMRLVVDHLPDEVPYNPDPLRLEEILWRSEPQGTRDVRSVVLAVISRRTTADTTGAD